MSKVLTFSLVCCVAVAGIVYLAACGNTNPGSGVGVFRTVTVAASAPIPALPSKVFAGASCSNDVHTGGTLTVDAPLLVTLTSTLYPGEAATDAQPVTITGYTIRYTALTAGAPVLPNIELPGGNPVPLGAVIPAGGALPVSIPVITDTAKGLMQSNATMQKCAPNDFIYAANITFFGTELGGTNATFSAGTSVDYTNVP